MKKKLFIVFILILALTSCRRAALSYYEIGVAKNELRDFQGAIADLGNAIKQDPNKSKYYFERGLSKRRKEQTIPGTK